MRQHICTHTSQETSLLSGKAISWCKESRLNNAWEVVSDVSTLRRISYCVVSLRQRFVELLVEDLACPPWHLPSCTHAHQLIQAMESARIATSAYMWSLLLQHSASNTPRQPWAARYNAELLNTLTPKGVVFPFLFFLSSPRQRQTRLPGTPLL